ncbi:DUF2019 domain-containing protein [Nitratireductor luteus]|uniref:DUF2019 domain-containing protein n=1 Tax=Nitratireductor luteus TaxID=2976980 RepID=UPI00223F4C93|nr:DUF2019 domain-containing protein [Nitratireductor luteus]
MDEREKIAGLSDTSLVSRYTEIGILQDEALLDLDTKRLNRLFDELLQIEIELRSRDDDQRQLLIALLEHPNMQVRLNAAKATLAVDYDRARSVIEAMATSKRYQQAGDAGMTVGALDQGIFVPE